MKEFVKYQGCVSLVSVVKHIQNLGYKVLASENGRYECTMRPGMYFPEETINYFLVKGGNAIWIIDSYDNIEFQFGIVDNEEVDNIEGACFVRHFDLTFATDMFQWGNFTESQIKKLLTYASMCNDNVNDNQ